MYVYTLCQEFGAEMQGMQLVVATDDKKSYLRSYGKTESRKFPENRWSLFGYTYLKKHDEINKLWQEYCDMTPESRNSGARVDVQC
jgi:hypothetical protein